MKKRIYISVLFLICFFIFISFLNYKNKTYTSFSYSKYIPIINYGKSPHYDLKNNILIQLDQFITEKHYIQYSWITGDKSGFVLILTVEDTNKNDLPQTDKAEIKVTDDKGNIYTPFPYYEILPYPEDNPLNYKKIIYAKFEPLKDKSDFLDCEIFYEGIKFLIKDIKL